MNSGHGGGVIKEIINGEAEQTIAAAALPERASRSCRRQRTSTRTYDLESVSWVVVLSCVVIAIQAKRQCVKAARALVQEVLLSNELLTILRRALLTRSQGH